MAKPQKTGGRTKGTPNKSTAAIREAINTADPIGFLIKALKSGAIAEEGDRLTNVERIRIAEFLAKKTTPDAKERAITFEVGNIDSAEAARAALGRVIEAMGQGDLTPSEASSVSAVIQGYLKAYELGELAAQMAEIEQLLKEKGVAP